MPLEGFEPAIPTIGCFDLSLRLQGHCDGPVILLHKIPLNLFVLVLEFKVYILLCKSEVKRSLHRANGNYDVMMSAYLSSPTKCYFCFKMFVMHNSWPEYRLVTSSLQPSWIGFSPVILSICVCVLCFIWCSQESPIWLQTGMVFIMEQSVIFYHGVEESTVYYISYATVWKLIF
jgi:hypothetical protein